METSTTTPQLFLTDYASYNNGTQFEHGHWIDLGQFSDVEELETYISEHFEKAGIESPEPMFTDYEGLPEALYSESMSSTDLAAIMDYVTNDENIYKMVEEADDSQLVNLWNTACEELNCFDDQIYSFDDEFFEMAFSGQPMKAARAASFGSVNWSDDWITFDGYANLQSISDVRSHIDEARIFEAYESDPRAF